MKRNTFVLVTALFVGGVISCGSMAQAQEKAAEPKTNAPAARPPASFNRTESLARRLNLTDEQKEKVRPIMEEETKKYEELRPTLKDMTPQDRSAKYKEIREATNAKLKLILTDEQWQKHTNVFQTRVQTTARTNAAPANRPAPQPAK
jgi:Spy/CpxP family protein refolding chaperone